MLHITVNICVCIDVNEYLYKCMLEKITSVNKVCGDRVHKVSVQSVDLAKKR